MATLAECISRWHAAHPDFSLLTPALISVGTTCGEQTSEAPSERDVRLTASCVQNPTETGPAPASVPEGRWRRAATKIGISFEAYRQHRVDGERWCSAHRDWHLIAEFRSPFVVSWCRAANRDYYQRVTLPGRRAS